ncbi:PEP-CTERM sorting domain-containing protein [Rheinheimera baltica]|uniref:PEP-CTERM sorting domain-containing protein n=1 Tax=Rheinheimera baltica TaxID=67576 RepID=UPI00273FA387|nr:PEP-CTERM sorting domain-containing protein [Rheinheimera baltica]MDP5189701.1 PEP-CTERM sorting domain-containing protein [Rheinheimera baltica]
MYKLLLGAALASALFVSNAHAGLIYEQGLESVATGHNPFKYNFSYDDFTLDSSYDISRITVNAFANFGNLDNIGNMDWEIRSVLNGLPGGILFSGNVGSVAKNDTSLNFNGWDLVDYSIDVTSFNLMAGSYFIGLRANNAQNVHLTLINNRVNITEALVANGSGYTGYWGGRDFAYRLEGEPGVASVPEPLSIALLGLGLAGIGFSRKKKKV